MPQEGAWIGQGHIVSHLFVQNHVGTEIGPKLSLYLLILPTDFLKENDSALQPCVCDSDCQLVSVQGEVWTGVGKRLSSVWYFTFPSVGWCCPCSLGQSQGSWQQRGTNLPASLPQNQKAGPHAHNEYSMNARFQCARQYPLSFILQVLYELGVIFL